MPLKKTTSAQSRSESLSRLTFISTARRSPTRRQNRGYGQQAEGRVRRTLSLERQSVLEAPKSVRELGIYHQDFHGSSSSILRCGPHPRLSLCEAGSLVSVLACIRDRPTDGTESSLTRSDRLFHKKIVLVPRPRAPISCNQPLGWHDQRAKSVPFGTLARNCREEIRLRDESGW